MRTKVEKKQRVLEEKLKLNMPSPKVVLDASDCARLLDGASKTSVIVVEREGKMVAASSVATSSSSSSDPSVSSAALPLGNSGSTPVQSSLSQMTEAALVSTQTRPSDRQSVICQNVSGSTLPGGSAKIWPKTETGLPASKDEPVSSRKPGPDHNKAILKPPKKRRGIEVEFEIEASSHSVLKNGVADACPQLTLPKHSNSDNDFCSSSQRHSVERILQNSSVVPLQSHHEQPHSTRLTGMEFPPPSTSEPSVPSLKSSSSTSPHLSQPPSDPSEASHNSGHSYHPLELQSKSATHDQPLPKDKKSSCSAANVHDTTTSGRSSFNGDAASHTTPRTTSLSEKGHPKSFRLSPVQDEPINLTTCEKPGEPVVSLVTSQAGSITSPAEGCEPVPVFTRKCVDDGHPSSSSITPGGVSKVHMEGVQHLLETESESISGHPSDPGQIQQNGLPGQVHSLDTPTEHCDPSEADRARSSPRSPPQADTNSTGASAREDHPQCNSPVTSGSGTASTSVDNELPLTGLPQTKCVESCQPSSETDTHIPEASSTDGSQLSANDILVSKNKKPSKKKVEIPMDDVSCAHRLTQYALTIDDVIANFVYVPEPVEEIRLTEEEESALRDQFDEAEQSTNRVKVSSTSQVNAEKIPCEQFNSCHPDSPSANPASDSPAVHSAETQTTIYPVKSVPKKNSGQAEKESQPDGSSSSQTSSNIDSILAAVASDVTQPNPKTSQETSHGDKKKKKKKVSKKAPGVEREGKEVEIGAEKVLSKESKHLVEGEVSPSSQVCKDDAEPDTDRHPGTKPIKTKKAKKRKSTETNSNSEKSTHLTDSVTTEDQSSGAPVKKKKKVVKKSKSVKGGDKNSEKHSASLSDNPTELTTALMDSTKDYLGASKATETSDIGESIASTSGGSEQDTPVHESELLTGKSSHASKNSDVDKDKDSRDTGLESSGGEDSLNKPVRRYKKRLDFVKCDQCEHQARGRSALSRHMKKVHQVEVDMPHKCPHCSYGCSKQASLNRHLFTHGVFSCSRCPFVGETRLTLTQHVLENHRDKLDLKLCKICNRYIKCDQVSIEEHTSKCQGPTPYQCSVCHKEFKYGSSLRVHYHTHFPDQPKKFKCELCDYRTNYKANLHKHHKNMHAVKGKEIQCPDCGKLFSTEDNMRRHRKVHTLARPFACETCKKTFKTSGALKGHQLIHTATRPYTCNITGCNRSFRTPKFLKSHQEEFHRLVPKKFFCSVEGCNYSFFKRSHLKRHAITHTGERNFHCTWPGCSKSFRHSDNLKVHFRSHTTERVLQCQLCEFKTKQKNSMFWHKKKVHQIVESTKSSGTEGTKSSKSSSLRSDGGEAASVATQSSSAPAVAESGCQTALALSEHSEDGSLMEGPTQAQGRDSETSPAKGRQLESSTSKVEPVKDVADRAHAESAEGGGSRDLYEFKSDDDSEDETAALGNFRRDLIPKEELTPLPPPPKELLMKNELEEQRELARKEREQKKELEKKEKIERRELEKKERAEKKELEKKEKNEKKELEKKEKIEKKEMEKKEKIEKKELEKKEKEEKKELEKKERLEKKELEKKEKLEQKELEKKEKLEKKEQEKKEKIEKKELEMKEKEEKREKEKQEKEQARIEKEQAKVEKEQARIEKEKAKKEKEEQRKVKEQLRLEKEKEKEKKKAEKESMEKDKVEEKENKEGSNSEPIKKKLKPGKKIQKKTGENAKGLQLSTGTKANRNSVANSKKQPQAGKKDVRIKSPARAGRKKSQALVRKKSPRRLSSKGEEEEEEVNQEKPKRGRKKKVQEEAAPTVTKGVGTRNKRLNTEPALQASPVKKKRMSKKLSEDAASNATSPRSPRSPRGASPRAASRQTAVDGRKRMGGRGRKPGVSPGKKKNLPVARKMSARIKAKAQTASVKSVKAGKGRRGAKPGPKKKVVEKQEDDVAETAKEEEEEENEKSTAKEQESAREDSMVKVNAEKEKESKAVVKKEKVGTKKKVETKKISTRRAAAVAAKEDGKDGKKEAVDESIAIPAIPDRPASPAYSEELMLQGNASPYRDFSDADNIEDSEEKEEKGKCEDVEKDMSPSPTSNGEVLSHDRGLDHKADEPRNDEQPEEEGNQGTTGSACGSPETTEPTGKEEEPDACHNDDAYSSDDDVSNDIPLTPPRAPAPPPVESSEDEMEEAVEPEPSAPFSVPGPNTPFSVPGPNTPFSVPGPHTPFSVPPPTNLTQQQHSVPSEDTPLSTVPSVPSTEIHSHGSVELQHSLGSVEMQPSQNSVEMHQPQGSVEMHQPQGSVEMHHSHGSNEMHAHNTSGEMRSHGSVEMHHSHGSNEMHAHNTSGEMRSHGSVEMHISNTPSGDLLPQASQGSAERNHHPQGPVQLQPEGASLDHMHSHHRPVEIYPHDSVEMRQQDSFDPHSEASTLQKLRDEAMNSVKSSDTADPSSVSDKYQYPHQLVENLAKYSSFPHPLPEHSHSEADKAYFDQYLKNLSTTRGGLSSGPGSSPTGLQQLEAMVGKSHVDNGGSKSPVSSLPSSVITSLENNLPGDSRVPRGDNLPHPHEALYTGRETPSSLPRMPDRQSTNTPLPPSGAPTPAFEAFSHLNPMHAAPPSATLLRQADSLFPNPPVSSSFMAEAMFQRQAMSTPFLPPPPPQAGERSSVLTSSSSTLLRRPTSEMFSASQAMQQTMPRNPFTNAWASQDSRPSHWQTPYLPRQSNMATPGSFFPGKESYLTGREFMFDPTSVRASADGRSMFPSLSGSCQSQDSLPLDRFDLSNYFPNAAAAMAPYGSSAAATSLDYTRTAHTSSTKPFDERYRQASVGAGATSGAIPDFRSLPAVSGSGPDMFAGIPGVNPGFNLYAAAGNPMSYHHHHHHHPHAQHPHHHQLADSSVNSAFLSHHHPHHPGSAQHAAMYERDYRGLYPQNAAAAAAAAYPFINERQYPGSTSKLAHTHPTVGPSASASSRASAPEGQMQDPYRTMLYRY